MVRNRFSHRIRQKDDLSPITKGFHAFAKARTVGPAGRLFRPFPLDEKEWNEIHSMARKQTVQGIIYDGIRLLPDEAVPPRKVLLGWMVEVDTLERVNRQHGETLKGLQQIYAQPPSIPLLLLKGIGLAGFYPHPEHRIAGDIDLWFGNEAQTEEANQRMEKLGLPVKGEPTVRLPV